jgi:hypothetical protein
LADCKKADVKMSAIRRVKEEFARLYADSSDETEELSGGVAQTLNFAAWNN